MWFGVTLYSVETLYTYSDNILEGIRFVDALDKHSDHLSLIDEDFTNPAEPDFTLSSPDGERIRLVIRGSIVTGSCPRRFQCSRLHRSA